MNYQHQDGAVGLRIGITVVFALSAYLPVSAQPMTSQTFYDDRVLDAAVANIITMNEHELNAFANMIASCEDELSQNEIIQHDCTVARKRYDVEFGENRPLDKLTGLLGLIALHLRLDDSLGVKNNSEDSKMIERLSAIDHKFSETANLTFGSLRLK